MINKIALALLLGLFGWKVAALSSTPGVVIDGQAVHAGGMPDRKQIDGWSGDLAT